MNYEDYLVVFEGGGSVEVKALCEKDAVILAKAQRIHDALSYDIVVSVRAKD